MVFVETPTNPVMIVTDLKAVSDVAHAAGARVVCDNTFMSPYLQRPLEFGVDIVVHSTTKFLNGHSDGIGGAVVLNNEDDANWIAFIQNSAGAILSPFDSWLVMRGTKTLALRMEQHDKSGRAVAHLRTIRGPEDFRPEIAQTARRQPAQKNSAVWFHSTSVRLKLRAQAWSR